MINLHSNSVEENELNEFYASAREAAYKLRVHALSSVVILNDVVSDDGDEFDAVAFEVTAISQRGNHGTIYGDVYRVDYPVSND